MELLDKIIDFTNNFRAEIEPHWSEELLYEKFVASDSGKISAGYCGPSSVLLFKRLIDAFPNENFSVAVGRVYENSKEYITGKHVWIILHRKSKGAIVIDVTADQAANSHSKIIIEDIDVLAKSGINYIPYQFARTLSEVNESPKKRADILESRLN